MYVTSDEKISGMVQTGMHIECTAHCTVHMEIEITENE